MAPPGTPPIMVDRTPTPAHMRKDSALDDRDHLAFVPTGGLSAMDMKYFPNSTYPVTVTTPLNERQREILGSVKGRELTAVRRESTSDSNSTLKAETPCSSLGPLKGGLKKRIRPRPRDTVMPSRTLSPVVGAVPNQHIYLPEFGKLRSTPIRCLLLTTGSLSCRPSKSGPAARYCHVRDKLQG